MSFFVPIVNAVLGAVGLILLIVCIIIAPWQLKLVLLAVGLAVTQRALQSLQVEPSTSSIPEVTPLGQHQRSQPQSASVMAETTMSKEQALADQGAASSSHRFTYRGSEYKSPLASQQGTHEKLVTGKSFTYRGSEYTPPSTAQDSTHEKLVTGKYRGADCRLHIHQPSSTHAEVATADTHATIEAN
ncbi:MAG: DUF4278 domain-containing protein [Cyanobacteria bacterium]|nr:DUF4278 domain-containing protein [Cyanobacteriota bacterium]MDW8201326.1 DUF4278 domain-containing protein [Cyanobacteriota bacterium SKYGB_h_bin112]